MIRAIVGVVVGYIVWTVIWLAGNVLLLADIDAAVRRGELYTQAGPLALAVAVSVICSLAAGFTCAKIVAGKPRPGAAAALCVCLLATGIGVQASVWHLEPLWYHLTFLVLLVPMTLAGARIGK